MPFRARFLLHPVGKRRLVNEYGSALTGLHESEWKVEESVERRERVRSERAGRGGGGGGGEGGGGGGGGGGGCDLLLLLLLLLLILLLLLLPLLLLLLLPLLLRTFYKASCRQSTPASSHPSGGVWIQRIYDGGWDPTDI
jgi:hypothetical protein